MAKILAIIYFATCIVMMAQMSGCIEISGLYIKMPLSGINIDSNGNYDVGYFFQWLVQLNLADSNPEAVLKQLNKLDQDESTNYMMKSELVEPLISLASDRSDCSEDPFITRTFLKVYQIASKSQKLKNPQALLGYLEQYGKQKFQICALDAAQKLKESSEIDEILEKVGNSFDSNRISPSICRKLFDDFKIEFDVLNLASNLNDDSKYFEDGAKLTKLNVINRSCLQ